MGRGPWPLQTVALVFGIDLIYPRSAHVCRMLPVAVAAHVLLLLSSGSLLHFSLLGGLHND